MKLRTSLIAAAVASCLSMPAIATAGGRPDLVLSGLEKGRAHQSGEMIIKFAEGASGSQQAAYIRGLGAARIDTLRRGGGETVLVRLAPGQDVAASVRAVSRSAFVDFAEPNWIYQHSATNDPYVSGGNLWGMYGDASSPANAWGSQAA